MTRQAVVRTACIIWALLAVVLSAGHASAATHTGDGGVRINRLPWAAGQGIVLTQGWGGATSHTGTLYYATDWDIAGAETFSILAVAEGDATCGFESTATGGVSNWGYYVLVDRADDEHLDRYAHLPSCPFQGTRHLEQGDYISPAGDSPGLWPVHLHYQRETADGVSVSSCLSQFCDFDDATHYYDTFISDNAGPGLNPWNGDVWDQIRWRYAVGHFGGNAWDRFGSSIDIGDGYSIALPYTFAGDSGWHQEFREPASQGSGWNDFARPDACNKAYVIPEDYYSYYIFYADQLGQPRSEITVGTILPYYQLFRHGMMWSMEWGEDPNIVLDWPTTACE